MTRIMEGHGRSVSIHMDGHECHQSDHMCAVVPWVRSELFPSTWGSTGGFKSGRPVVALGRNNRVVVAVIGVVARAEQSKGTGTRGDR